MTARIVEELQRLARDMQRLSSVFEDARFSSSGSPKETEETDETDTVGVVVDSNAQPISIWIRDDWESVVGPDRLGDCVLEAASAAAIAQLDSWRRSVEHAVSSPSDTDAPPATGHSSTDTTDQPIPGMRNLELAMSEIARVDIGHIVETAIEAFDSIEEIAGQSTFEATGTGRSSGDEVEMVFTTAGLGSCTIDPRWARGRSGSVISKYLNQVAKRAKRAFDQAVQDSASTRHTSRFDSVLAEALAAIADPTKLTRSQDGRSPGGPA